MISQLLLRASGNKTPGDLISQMQLSPALLRRYRQAVCPRQKLRPVDNVSPLHRNSSRTRSRAAALMLHNPPWTASPQVHAA